ncbi:Autoinducer 2-binding periplasmic protein LuxP [Candidatus Terasakiella magnetica]|uniref:Autoinducer 2-binding periplasmic protein LuxP n=1 Tax=Candidatus Terasakiella magnetica TaxID=1867952 RepID=A0A1C3RJ65_9PROT|nr:substrate-binding domain-containing protein [Candidatus Terasakiella magnetica]SCA57294.1 Autoinducer 2-binding periplasmic protein LuxP [Candidatus Terasakiella magnetica]
MIRILCISLLLVWAGEGFAGSNGSDYWTYHEYMSANPEQREKTDKFSQRVRAKASEVQNIQKPVKVAVVYPGKQVSDYWWRSVSSFEARLQELNLPYEIHPSFTEPGVGVRLQERQIAQVLQKDPDYLVFTLDAFRHRTIIERIMQRGRPKLILQNITTPVRAWAKQQPFLYVGFDHAVGSVLLAEKFLKTFPKKTDYALFYGTRGYVSSVRGGTFMEHVLREGQAKVSDSFYLDFNREKSKKAALNVLAKENKPPFIYACSTDIALGVIDAAKELGILDQITVNGWGGGGNELKAIAAGELDFTVMRMNDDNGVAMADAIAMDLQGMGASVPTVYSGDMELIEKGMSAGHIEALRKRAFRYSDHFKTQTDQVVRFGGR